MPRRVDATEQLLSEIRKRVPLQFLVHTGHTIPRIGPGEVAFWKDTSTGKRGVGKIVMRIGRDRFIISSSREQVSVGSGEVLIDDDDQEAGYLDDKLLVSGALTKTVNNHPGNFDGGDTLTIGLNPADIDHGALGGLGDDDHAQYALLAGRSGGQTLNGGTGSSENLTLQSTAGAAKGTLWLEPNTSGRLVAGNDEFDPYVSSNVYSGRYFFSAEDQQGSNNPNSVLHVAQFVKNSETYPYAVSIAQRLFKGVSGSALFVNAQFQATVAATLARAVYAYVSVGGSNDPTATTAIGVTSRIEASNHANYTTAHGFHALAAIYGSAKIQTYNAFEAEAPDSIAAGLDHVRGLHVGDIGQYARDSCDSILVDAQDDGFDGLSGNIRMAGGDWNTGHLQLGQAHVWATSGDLRFSRTEPYNATDYDFAILSSTVDFKNRRGVNLSDPTDPQDAATKSYVDSAVATDHGALSGLSDDDHPQYALLAGRSGGQTLHGGSADSEDLVLRSTAGSTLGHVHLADQALDRVTVGDKDTESALGKLHVGLTQSNGASANQWRYGVKVQFECDASLVTYPDAVKAEASISGGSADGRGVTGVAGFAVINSNVTETSSELRGMVAAVQSESGATSATIGTAIGLRAGVAIYEGNTYQSAHAVEAKFSLSDTSTITSAVHFRAFTPSIASGATLSSIVGLQVEDLAGGSTAPADGQAIKVFSQSFGSATKGNVYLAGGDWNTGHLVLGAAHAWATSGEIRFSTTAPTSATDYDLSIGSTIDVASRRIVNVSDPTNAQDAATKAYVDAHAGGGLSDAYASITDGTNTASASGSDTFKLRSANDRLTIVVANDDATHGDNALFTLDETKIVHQNLSGAGTHDHSDIDSHIDASSGVHGVSGSVVGTTDTQTLTNKTLSSPSIQDASVSGSTSVTGTVTVDSSGTLDGSGAADTRIKDVASSSTNAPTNTGSLSLRIGQVSTRGWTGNRVIQAGGTVYVAYRQLTVSVLEPQSGDSITLLETHDRIYVREIVTCVRGSSSPSVNFNLKWSTDRASSSPYAFWSTDQTANSSTAQSHWGAVNRTLSRKAFLWLDISSISGTVDEFSITIYYTIRAAQSSEGD